MTRVYLDKNIYSHFKDGTLSLLFDFLVEKQNYFIMPFSPALMLDLINYNHEDENARNKLYEEFPFIDKIALNHLVQYNPEMDIIECFQIKPSNFIEFEKQEFHVNSKRFTDIPNVDKLSPELWCKICNLNTQNFETGRINGSIFSKKERSFVFEIFTSAGIIEKKIKELKSQIDQKYKIDASNEDCISQLESKLQKDGIDLEQIIDELVDLIHLPLSTMAKYQGLYLALELFNNPCKEDKNNIDSILKDAQHSFFAVHSNVLISCDRGIIDKTRAIASWLKLPINSIFISPKLNELEDAQKQAISVLDNYINDTVDLTPLREFKEGYDSSLGKYYYSHLHNYLNFFDIAYHFVTQQQTTIVMRKNMKTSFNYLFMYELDQVFKNLEMIQNAPIEELRQLRNEFYFQKTNGVCAWEIPDFFCYSNC